MDYKAMEAARYAKAQEAYDKVPQGIKDDLHEALVWAKRTLTNYEGIGHHFELSYDPARNGKPEGFVASFAKPQWNADHASQPMPTAQEAIVMAVCEYLNGV